MELWLNYRLGFGAPHADAFVPSSYSSLWCCVRAILRSLLCVLSCSQELVIVLRKLILFYFLKAILVSFCRSRWFPLFSQFVSLGFCLSFFLQSLSSLQRCLCDQTPALRSVRRATSWRSMRMKLEGRGRTTWLRFARIRGMKAC